MDFYEARHLVNRYDTKTLKIDDINWVWRPKEEVPIKIKCLMVESYLLGLPLDVPVLRDIDHTRHRHLYKNEDEPEWIRGNNFLYTLQSFKQNEFKLEGLRILDELNDSSYEDFHPYIQKKYIHREIRYIEIEHDFPIEYISRLSISTYV